MSKAVLISIRPKWVEKIANGEKTIEVRKTRPNLPTPFKAYIYCTLPKYPHEDFIATDYPRPQFYGGGKVVGEFTCDKIEHFDSAYSEWAYAVAPPRSVMPMHESKALRLCCVGGCLTEDDVTAYFGDEDWKAYFWHISDLKIYDTPRELGEFWLPPELYCEKERCGGCPYDQVADVNGEYSYDCEWRRPLSRPPQSWCYVEEVTK